MFPDRIVVGVWDEGAAASLEEVYRPILTRDLPPGLPAPPRGSGDSGPVPFVVVTPVTAELIKYTANAFLAVKISFINEIAWIAEELGADITQVARAVGLDRRIGPHFLRAGIGWGGSCFPKDIVALRGMAEIRGLSASMLSAANEVNARQHRWVIRKLQEHLRTLVGRRIAFLGLTFKPNTDDLRNAPSLEIAGQLATMAARVRAYDPSINELPDGFARFVELAGDPFAAVRDADAVVLITEWAEFADLDLRKLRQQTRGELLLDGRNFLDPSAAGAAGFKYVGVGR
jgi:UDPglucose 6-dehydrogenase